MEDWKQHKGVFAATAGTPLLWLILFFVVPMGILWLYSFGRNVGLTGIEISGTFSNYARALDPFYLKLLGKSVAVAALTTVICLIVAFPVALAITFSSPRVRALLLLAVMLPFWTNLLIRTFALIAVLRQEGYANHLLGWLWEQASWLKTAIGLQPLYTWEPLSLLYNNFAVVLGLVYVHLPFMVLPLYAALDRLDKSLIEASLDLGAGQWTTINRIVVPLAAPGVLSGVIITFIPALGAYLTPDLMGGTDSKLIASVIEAQFKRSNNWPLGAALSFLLMYATFILIAFQASRAKKASRLA